MLADFCLLPPSLLRRHGQQKDWISGDDVLPIHDGVFKTLEEVANFLNKGEANPNLNPLIKPLGLTAAEKTELLAFLKALEGESLKIEIPKLP